MRWPGSWVDRPPYGKCSPVPVTRAERYGPPGADVTSIGYTLDRVDAIAGRTAPKVLLRGRSGDAYASDVSQP